MSNRSNTNNTPIVTDAGGYVYQYLFYSPFGESLYSQHAQTGEYNTPHRFNAKELDVETGNYYYGARYYNPRVSVWLSVDPLAHKYPNVSSYLFVLNNPINAIDPDGKEVYFIVYTGGSPDAYDAAKTRMNEIHNSKGYDRKKDHVYFIESHDLGALQNQISNSVADAEKNGYGLTVELSIYGHNGSKDGPVGAMPTSMNALSDITGDMRDNKQLSPDGWKNINFNFDPNNSVAAFYGCNTDQFAQKFFSYSNVGNTVGQMGGAGGSYNYKGKFNAAWFPLGRNVYMVTQESGNILPNNVYSRSTPYDADGIFNDSQGNRWGYRTSCMGIFGNATMSGGNVISGTE